MTITEIKPVTRIEGDGKLIIDTYADASGKLRAKRSISPSDGTLNVPTDNASRYPKFSVTEFRGFEKFVVGEQPETVAKLVMRICGVCPVPHGVASSNAIEAAYGISISTNAKAIRRLMQALHTIHSHLMHIFILGGRDVLPHSLLDSEFPRIIEAHNKVQACVSVIGRRPVHSAAILPGGQTKAPTADDINTIKARLEEVNGYLVSLMGTLRSNYLNMPNDFGIRSASYLSSGIPFYSGVSGSYSYDGSSGGVILRNSSNPSDFALATIIPFDPANVREEEITPYKQVINSQANYSYARRPYYAYDGVNYVVETGPIARLAVAYKAGDTIVKSKVDGFASSWGLTPNDILSPTSRNRHIARLLETQILIDRVINSWADAVTRESAFADPTKKAGSGIGVVEAPRGVLIHKIAIGTNLNVASLDVIVPTTVNSAAIEEAVADNLVEITPETASLLKASESASDKNLKVLLGDASRTVRSFDPCCSCSSHVLGIELPDGVVVHRP